MHHAADAQLLREAEQFQLRATCEHCVYFETEAGGCAEEFPNDVHRLRTLRVGDTVIFCKKFELL